MSYDSFVRDRLPPPELLPEFGFDLPELHYPERLNAAAELLKGGAPVALAIVNDHGRWTYADLDAFSGRIARLTCYVTSIEEYLASLKEIGEAWKETIGAHYPAMALVEVVRLVEPEAKIEIEATAVVPE